MWEAVEEAVGQPVSDEVRVFCRLQGFDDIWTVATSEPDRQRIVDKVVRTVENLAAAGFDTAHGGAGSILDPGTDGEDTDKRWALWRDLERVRRAELGGGEKPDWAPFVVTRVFDISSRPLYSERIELSIDSRVPLRRIKRELDKLWKSMASAGWVKRSRPLGNRGIALVHFVCIESKRGATWRERLDAWNSEHADSTFNKVQAFQSAFRRAESQLTGSKYGLAWFYDEEIHAEDYASLRPSLHLVPLIWLRAKGNRRWAEIRAAQVQPLQQVAGRIMFREHMRSLSHWIEDTREAYAVDGIGPPPSVQELLDEAEDEAEGQTHFGGFTAEDLVDPGIGEWRVRG